jgi:hypothetical protein
MSLGMSETVPNWSNSRRFLGSLRTAYASPIFLNLDPRSPHAQKRAAHRAACEAVQPGRADRRVLCAGHFVVVELDGHVDAGALAVITNTVEKLGLSVVVTLVREN